MTPRTLAGAATLLMVIATPLAAEPVTYRFTAEQHPQPYSLSITYDNSATNIEQSTWYGWTTVARIPDAEIQLTIEDKQYSSSYGVRIYHANRDGVSQLRIESIQNPQEWINQIDLYADIQDPNNAMNPMTTTSGEFSFLGGTLDLYLNEIDVFMDHQHYPGESTTVRTTTGSDDQALCQNVQQVLFAAQQLANYCY